MDKITENGRLLAKKPAHEFYDQEIIKMIAGTTGMPRTLSASLRSQ
ncbi:MAG: hypothetical protein PUD90_09135 [Clostridia bacterium]|nr:hypothetical protein [[Bacteroides] pectinophilus]MDD5873609.1 hypothetical protein [Clostridia bacterium]